MHSSSNFPLLPCCLSLSLHSSPSFSAYLTTMATSDVVALTEPCLIEDNRAKHMRVRRHTHTHPQTHCGRTPLMGETIQKYSKQARTMSDTEGVWKWEKKKLRGVGERVKWNDRDVYRWEPRVTMELNQIAPAHVLTPSKTPVHIHLLTTYIYAPLYSGENKLFPAFEESRRILQTDRFVKTITFWKSKYITLSIPFCV